MNNYNPFNWYWLADDGRVFSSADSMTTYDTDPAYQAWVTRGHIASRWPSDDAGQQSGAAMQAVLAPYGLFADLKAYAAAARFTKETGGVTVNGIALPTDRATQAQLTGAFNYVQVTPTASIQWKLADGSFVALSKDAITSLATAVAAHVQACFAKEAEIVAAIDASPATVTTRAQVDAAFAAI